MSEETKLLLEKILGLDSHIEESEPDETVDVLVALIKKDMCDSIKGNNHQS